MNRRQLLSGAAAAALLPALPALPDSGAKMAVELANGLSFNATGTMSFSRVWNEVDQKWAWHQIWEWDGPEKDGLF